MGMEGSIPMLSLERHHPKGDSVLKGSLKVMSASFQGHIGRPMFRGTSRIAFLFSPADSVPSLDPALDLSFHSGASQPLLDRFRHSRCRVWSDDSGFRHIALGESCCIGPTNGGTFLKGPFGASNSRRALTTHPSRRLGSGGGRI